MLVGMSHSTTLRCKMCPNDNHALPPLAKHNLRTSGLKSRLPNHRAVQVPGLKSSSRSWLRCNQWLSRGEKKNLRHPLLLGGVGRNRNPSNQKELRKKRRHWATQMALASLRCVGICSQSVRRAPKIGFNPSGWIGEGWRRVAGASIGFPWPPRTHGSIPKPPIQITTSKPDLRYCSVAQRTQKGETKRSKGWLWASETGVKRTPATLLDLAPPLLWVNRLQDNEQGEKRPRFSESLNVAPFKKNKQKQGSLHHTPEHCLVNCGVLLFWWRKAMFQQGKMYLLRSPEKLRRKNRKQEKNKKRHPEASVWLSSLAARCPAQCLEPCSFRRFPGQLPSISILLGRRCKGSNKNKF